MASRTYLIFFLMILFVPFTASGHVKWFTTVEPVKASIEEILSPFFIVLSLLIAIILGILPQLIPYLMKWPVSKKLERKLASLHHFTPYILRYGVAVALVVQMLYSSIVAPEIALTRQMAVIGIITAGLLLIPHRFATRLAAVGLLTLFILPVRAIGCFHMLDYGFYLAIVVALLLQQTEFEDLGTPGLYLGTGLSLCWVAVEKWVFPEMSLNILEGHQIPTFGFPPDIFLSLSAFIEFVVGYLMVVGILNRVLAAVVTVLFILTTTVFGGVEIAGHFLIHIILIIFIIEGTGFYNPPINMHQRTIDQVIFVVLNFLFVLSTFLLIYYRFA